MELYRVPARFECLASMGATGSLCWGKTVLELTCEQADKLRARLDGWLKEMYGVDAERMAPWFDVTQESYEAELGMSDLMRLMLGLIKCPHCAYHFDVHPNIAEGRETTYNVYVEPAAVRTA